MRELLTTSNPKVDKGRAHGYLTAILHLAPADMSGRNVCPWSTAGCRAACLNTAGRGGIAKSFDAQGMPENAIQRARVERTRLFFADRGAFVAKLRREITLHVKRARALGLGASVRLNGTSDLPWESIAPELFAAFPDVQFYDYTKSLRRAGMYADGMLPGNYHLTFSLSETNASEAWDAQRWGVSVAVVYADPAAGRAALAGNVPWVDGDAHDLRFLDPIGAIVALKAKGRAKGDRSGFVVR